MAVVANLVFRYLGNTKQKWVELDRYGYLDLVCGYYSSVLSHITDGLSINFGIRCVVPNGGPEIDVSSDQDVCSMFEVFSTTAKIIVCVVDLQIATESTTVYTVNGFPSEIVGREIEYFNVGSLSQRGGMKNQVRRGRGTPTNKAMGSTSVRGRGSANIYISCDDGNDGDDDIQEITPSKGKEVRYSSQAVSHPNVVSPFRIKDWVTEMSTRQQKVAMAPTPALLNPAAPTPDVLTPALLTPPFVSKSPMPPLASSRSLRKRQHEKIIDLDMDNFDDNGGESFAFDEGSDDEWKDTEGAHEGATSDSGESVAEEGNDEGYEGTEFDVDDWDEYCSNDDMTDPPVMTDNGKVNLKTGQVFTDATAFRDMLKECTLQEGFETIPVKNEPRRCTYICSAEKCPWRVHASLTFDGKSFQIKTLNEEHTCTRKSTNQSISSNWIAKVLATELSTNPDMKVIQMAALLQKKYGIEVHPMKLYRPRKIARGENEGSHSKSYADLDRYGRLVRDTNPDSVYKLQFRERDPLRSPPVFKSLFLCFHACKLGFLNGCRPFIGIDGCSLKGTYAGTLLAAVSLDGNNNLFPLAIPVVETECKESWLFFLYHLEACLQLGSNDGILTFMSDKQKGLAEAISDIFAHAHHRFCCRHLYSNFKLKFSGMILKQHFWNACRATNAVRFQQAIGLLKDVNQDAHDWLMKHPVHSWSRHSFDHSARSEHVTNNMTESFNQMIAPYRSKPILTLIDQIRTLLMGRMHKRYEQGCNYHGRLTPKIKKKLESIRMLSRGCTVVQFASNEYEVNDGWSRYVVNIEILSYGCKEWECTGLPCKHAAAAILYKRGNLEDYCDEYFSVQRYLLAYGEMIHPMPDVNAVPLNDVLGVIQPPPLKRRAGRPRKNRRREPDEGGPSEFRKRSNTVRCEICKATGHNRRTCQGGPVKAKEKRMRTGSSGKQSVSSQIQTRSQSSSAVTTESAQSIALGKLAAKQAKRNERERAATTKKNGKERTTI